MNGGRSRSLDSTASWCGIDCQVETARSACVKGKPGHYPLFCFVPLSPSAKAEPDREGHHCLGRSRAEADRSAAGSVPTRLVKLRPTQRRQDQDRPRRRLGLTWWRLSRPAQQAGNRQRSLIRDDERILPRTRRVQVIDRHRRLLCPCRQRPRRPAAKQGDELNRRLCSLMSRGQPYQISGVITVLSHHSK